VVRMDLLGVTVAVAWTKHTGSQKRGGRTEKYSAFHTHRVPSAPRFWFLMRVQKCRRVNAAVPYTLGFYRSDL
jgi:hypothetical protein